MEIKILKKTGVPKAEVEAHQQIQREFSSSDFSKKWKGYASFAISRGGRGAGDDDFDLVLVTHAHIVVVELKNWHGSLLESDGQQWYLDGECRGTSPVVKANLNAKKLASLMQQKLGREKTPFISSYVVMHGDVKTMKVTPDEERSVLTMTEFLTLKYQTCYKNYLWGRVLFSPLDYLGGYDKFFEGPSFKPREYIVDGFRPEANPIFEHPKKLYNEYRATAKDDPTTLALLRQWDFTALGLELIGEKDRSFIGLREQRVYEYVAERNEELSLSLLRPVARKSPNDVNLDFSELFFLPSKVTRLAEFTHSVLPKLSPEERLTLTKALLSKFAELHDLRVAHRDVGDHSIWFDRPAKVVLSGFPAAYYPEMKTVGAFREKVKVEQSTLPEDSDASLASPYRRDVFMLGALAHLILFGEKPPKVGGLYEWSARAEDPFAGALTDFIKRALCKEPAERFQNAREMLEAFNAATARKQESIIDLTAFEAYKAASRDRDYEETETLADDDDAWFFKSVENGEAKLVKVWFRVAPDTKKPDQAVRLLSFLERARLIKGYGIAGMPKVFDFGLSRGSLMLVLEWVEGRTLADWFNGVRPYEERLGVAQSLLDTLMRIHALEIAHGDLHPRNIIVKEDGAVVLIDVLDLRLDAEDHYTTAYLPENYKSLTPFERDRYSTAAVLVELLGGTRQNPRSGEYPIPRVYEEIANLLEQKTLSTLEPLSRTVAAARQADDAEVPEVTVVVQTLAQSGVAPGEMRSDNGMFHVEAKEDKRYKGGVRFWVTGIGKQLSFSWKLSDDAAEFVRASSISQSQLLRSQTMAEAQIPVRIHLVDGPVSDVGELVQLLLQNERINRKLSNLAATPAIAREGDAVAEPAAIAQVEIEVASQVASTEIAISVTELWKALLDAEEDAFTTVIIAGEKRRNPSHDGQILVPYHTDNGVIDYERSDTVIVESQTNDGVWKSCGQLNLKETTFGELAELAIDKPFPKANFKIGSKLRLISNLEKGSFTRRRFAVDRILGDKAVVPSLVDYFERQEVARLEPNKYIEPSDDDLEVYSEGDKKLNPSQKEAFRKVLGNGPISLLQGPPGTGKTWFIASLLHYLMTKESARRILLVSQAHEAVNNALEKGLELCRSKGIEFNAVRLGSESAVSDSIRHLHATSVEQAYRERFKAEQKERIVGLASALGLPRDFTNEFVDLYLRLGMISERIAKLEGRRVAEGDNAGQVLVARVKALVETFREIASDVYDFGADLSPADTVLQLQEMLVEKYEVRSKDAIERLTRLIHLSDEWVSALGSPDANFAEFLAKSRTVVAGTLVGIGYRGAGVVQNIFDWVIIDEAGRAAPSELAVAMQAGHRILLVGDHHQLPPTFAEEVKDAICQRFSVEEDSVLFSSDFERIFDSEYGRKVGTTLLSQYRMAPHIGEVVSSCFYNGKLETGRDAPPKYYDLLPEYLSKQVTWIDTSPIGERGFEQASDEGKDKWNMAEARIVMNLLRQIVESDEFMASLKEDLQPQEPPIGIICMYGKQRQVIDQLKAEATWLGDARRLVKVDTVDSYQGKENRIIILSTVRNNVQQASGFLSSSNRVNVAMSRAMERLFIVGATKMWGGRNINKPLGRTLTKIRSLAEVNRAVILSAKLFQGN
ncbi:AAA domain-containing protein [Caballeronia zhejiangensis]|uniref:AAA domain-containing protein n=1 Tax=Caballeronia zhejiangensis TaxID=871203 RepID=UPI001EF668AF|nr:AAA domain-containing protein [Caballeronia zhejiangensis]MCG7399683.1 AAA domain-containing protein [Caballeronia zhejiangensis]